MSTAIPIEKHSIESAPEVDQLLDRALHRLRTHHGVNEAMTGLVTGLGDIWSAVDHRCWAEVVAICKAHPLYALLDQDPFTFRARTKPRGYAGDAVMIDYIYRGISDAGHTTTALGKQIFEYTAGFSQSARSVRDRRDLLAARIDATAQRLSRPRILSVACGHMREAALSAAVRNRALGSLCAMDQDRESLRVVSEEYGHLSEVEVMPASVKDLLKRNLRLADFDLIYASGLYDYLDQPIARSLTAVLAAGLRSGGTLLIGNFLPTPSSVGYMEALMDWSLIWRSENKLSGLASGIPESDIASIESFVDCHHTIAYLELTRR